MSTRAPPSVEQRQRARIAILEAELAGAIGALQAVAEFFEGEGETKIAAFFHDKVAGLRRTADVKPPGGVQ